MLIKKGQKYVLFRVNNFKKNSFIDKHTEIIKNKGFVWMLKGGRIMTPNTINEIINGPKIIFFRIPEKEERKYYYAEIAEINIGKPEKDYFYPDYYEELIEQDKFYKNEELVGTWIKLLNIYPIENTVSDKFYMFSSEKNVEEVIKTTMTSTLYIKTLEDVFINEK